ncbi:N-(5-amino-5-carboxypentanoyl)-L-cysteinyl-D-valine synthase, partial [Toxocara canis]
RGERVLARVEKNIDSLALYLATVRLGAIYVPLNPAYTPRETEHFIKDAEPKLFVTCNKKADAKFAERVSHLVDSSALSVNANKAVPDYGVESVEANDIACICYTSGTTGKSFDEHIRKNVFFSIIFYVVSYSYNLKLYPLISTRLI